MHSVVIFVVVGRRKRSRTIKLIELAADVFEVIL